MERMDISYRQAFEVLTSNRLVDALDLQRESGRVRERYGYGSPRHQGDGAPLWFNFHLNYGPNRFVIFEFFFFFSITTKVKPKLVY